MNYFEWSKEYFDTASEISEVIERLKAQRKNAGNTEKKEIDIKISKYRSCYYDCMDIANHLLERHKGVA